MTFRDNVEVNASRASGGGRGGMIAGGGIGALVVGGIIFFLTGDPSALLSGAGNIATNGQGDSAQTLKFEHCSEPGSANKYDDCRIIATAQSVDQVWSAILPEQANLQYEAPGLKIFKDAVNTGCGSASSSTGPFYCPGDRTAYFDTSFFDELARMGGSNAPLAQEYVVAHEFGHGIQDIEGTLSLSDYNDPGPDSNAVKIELQADCYAGIWAHHADDGSDALLKQISEDQIQTVISTTKSIGDDTIQKGAGQSVSPESWTHGSAEQRTDAFMRGYNNGTMSTCDYLGRNAYSS